MREGSLTTDLFVLAFNDFYQQLTGSTVLVLDNASIHKAHVVRACQVQWAAAGLTLFFIPPYSPELNHIEILWHRCKHYWVRPEDYASDQTLLDRVEHVLKTWEKTTRLLFSDYLKAMWQKFYLASSQ